MGYTTTFSLDIKGCKTEEEYASLCEKMKEKDLFGYAFSSPYEFNEEENIQSFDSFDNVKWYTSEQDMLELSAAFPQITFRLHGVGEEAGDLWNEYFHNGKAEFCQSTIIYEEPENIKW